MVSVLTRIFGAENIEMAEDVVQDALVSALESWKFRGVPDNPRAWLYKTAKNKAIDLIRRNKHSETIDFSDPEKQLLTSEYTLATKMNSYWQEHHIQNDFLGMMYACCDPKISQENQVTFILKSLCGFSTKEVAKSFLTSEDTISKRLYRTKEYFRKNKIRLEIPTREKIPARTQAVLSAIYLLFNEGYNSTNSDELIRKDLINQALHLCKSLLDNEKTQTSHAYALMALMCFHTARVESRISPQGELIQLAKQDRTIWNKELINNGINYLYRSGFRKTISSYHIEAAIAYQHCAAKSYQETDWAAILDYYDMLLAIAQDPIVALNRCLVILEIKGAQEAYRAIGQLKGNNILKKYYLYYASLGAIQQRLELQNEAISNYRKALELTQSKQEQKFLKDKIEQMLS